MNKCMILKEISILGAATDAVSIKNMQQHSSKAISDGLDFAMCDVFDNIESLRVAEERAEVSPLYNSMVSEIEFELLTETFRYVDTLLAVEDI